jgi:hypothetical protein
MAVRHRVTLLFILLVGLAPAGDSASPVPIVIELFTSEGCSSCPPADTLLQRLVDAQIPNVNVIALGEHVDYWDHQGWKDRFSSAALTDRQRSYATRFNVDSIYTPQMVVDGRAELVGSDASAARRAIDRAAAAPHGRVQIAAAGDAVLDVTVTATDLPTVARGDRADVVLAITEDGLTSHVTRGENHGRLLHHAAVVRRLAIIGEASTPVSSARTRVTLESGWQRARINLIAFVQERRSRTILASAASNVATISRP